MTPTLRRAPLALALLLGARPLAAQLPGMPAAAGAFVRPGLALAANLGSEADGATQRGDGGRLESSTRWTYGAAVGYAPGGARWQLSVGGAAQQWGEGYQDPATALGGRVTVPILRGARFGASAFGGAGVARARLAPVAGTGENDDDVVTLRQIPIGASLGLRGALAGRAWTVAVVPQFVNYQLSVAGDAISANRARVGLLAEAGITARIGVSVAFETGGQADAGDPGPRGSTLGLALSYALRGR